MGLYKRGSIWWDNFTIKGIRYLVSTKEKTRHQAQEALAKIIQQYKNAVINKQLPFSAIVANYLKLNHFSTLKNHTQKNYKTQLKKALEFFHDKDIFKPQNIYTYIEWLIQVKGLSSTTARSKDLTMLSKICEEVKKVGIISTNPLREVDLSSYKKHNSRVRYVTPEEYHQLTKYVTPDLLQYISFAIETGLRKGEQLGLTWDKVDLSKKEIYLTDTKNGNNRTVPLSPKAITILQQRQQLPSPFPMANGTLHGQYATLKQKAGITNLTWHDLRHTFATLAIKGLHAWQKAPMPITKLQLWLGHSDIKMTMVYSHLSVEDLKNEIKG